MRTPCNWELSKCKDLIISSCRIWLRTGACRRSMISGAGAICCSLGSCPDATLSLRAGDCQNDICCGLNSCWNANFSSNGPIRSLSCEGDACRRATASSLMGDLFCNTTTGPVCQDFEGEFQDIVPAQHSITCTGRDACNRASFTFSGVAWAD